MTCGKATSCRIVDSVWPTYFIPNAPQQGYYLTSLPYPIEVIESMAAVAEMVNGWSSFLSTDAMVTNASFVEATRRELLIQTEAPPEAMASTALFVTGTWRELLIQTEAPPEAMASTSLFVSGTLDTVLIQYSNWPPEAMISRASFVGGTRT